MTTLHRAYSALTIKDLTEGVEHVTIKGIASTPTVDRVGDVVNPLGARFRTPMPLLWQHKHDKPVGNVTLARPTRKGIPFEASLPIIKEAGWLKSRVDEAIQSIKYGLVAFVSVGFRPVAASIKVLETGGYQYDEWDWDELSLVTIPANPDAVISAVKSLDGEALTHDIVRLIKAGDPRGGAVPLITANKQLNGAVRLIRSAS